MNRACFVASSALTSFTQPVQVLLVYTENFIAYEMMLVILTNASMYDNSDADVGSRVQLANNNSTTAAQRRFPSCSCILDSHDTN